MSKPCSWQDVPPGTVAFGASARTVQTGLWRSIRPVFNLDKCISCLKCWVQCPDMSIMTDEASKVIGVNLFFCMGCGICKSVCPTGAVSMHPESDYTTSAANKADIPRSVIKDAE